MAHFRCFEKHVYFVNYRLIMPQQILISKHNTQTTGPVALQHPELIDLLNKAYTAEKAASYAYQGHAGSVKDPKEKLAILQIEEDEWNHRHEVLAIMNQYGIKPSRWYEIRFALIGKTISFSCHVIGWF